MSDKYQKKYHIPSARLQTWDYASNGAYSITICTAKRQHYFGEIINGKMELSVQVEMAHRYWLEIPRHFSFVMLDEFVVMPNHVHGIIIVDNRENFCVDDRIAPASVETGHALSLIPVFATREKIQFPLWLVPINPPLQNVATKINYHSAGNPVFMIISSVTMMNFIESKIISLGTRKIGTV